MLRERLAKDLLGMLCGLALLFAATLEPWLLGLLLVVVCLWLTLSRSWGICLLGALLGLSA